MTPEEHIQTMGEFVRDSQRIFTDGGNRLVAAELLWGALAHGLIAAADTNGWRCDGHQGYKDTRRWPGNSKARPRVEDGYRTSQPVSNSIGISTEDTWLTMRWKGAGGQRCREPGV